jgi:hypothetical protein
LDQNCHAVGFSSLTVSQIFFSPRTAYCASLWSKLV